MSEVPKELGVPARGRGRPLRDPEGKLVSKHVRLAARHWDHLGELQEEWGLASRSETLRALLDGFIARRRGEAPPPGAVPARSDAGL